MPLEIYKHHCALLEDELNQAQAMLNKARRNIAGLVQCRRSARPPVQGESEATSSSVLGNTNPSKLRWVIGLLAFSAPIR